MLYKQTVLLTGITFLGLTGYILRLEQLYFMAAVVAFVAAGSYAICLLSVRGLELQRGPARRLYEGELCELGLTLTNVSRLPKFFLGLADGLPQWLEPVGQSQFVVPTLMPGRSVELSYQVRAGKRGVYELGPITVSATDVLGAFRVERRLEAAQEVIVYPAAARVAPASLGGVMGFGGVETEQLSASGAGLEFYGIRDYRAGDALRRIHWPSTARLGHFAVVEFEENFGADLVLAIDLRRGTEFGWGKDATLEMAIKAAASLATFAVENGAQVVVAAQDARQRYFAVARRMEELPLLLEALARMEADGETPLPEVMAQVSEVAAGASAVLLTAAPDEAMEAAAARWIGRQAQVVAVLFDAASWGAQEAGDIYALSRRLEAAGAQVEIYRRGEGLEGLLGRTVRHAA
jgi:uncharacterized protein (DUF58 family)